VKTKYSRHAGQKVIDNDRITTSKIFKAEKDRNIFYLSYNKERKKINGG
jgi:hypothetical protein